MSLCTWQQQKAAKSFVMFSDNVENASSAEQACSDTLRTLPRKRQVAAPNTCLLGKRPHLARSVQVNQSFLLFQ